MIDPKDSDEGASDRCDIDPIAALRENDSFDLDIAKEILGKKPKKRGLPKVSYSSRPGPTPEWMKDPSKLPKTPPGVKR